MAVNIIVEDGTGKTDATSYVSIAEFKTYWTQKGITHTEDDDTIAVWLNSATQYADYLVRWGGDIYSYDQALQIPRINWVDMSGRILEDVPTQVKNGVCELAQLLQGDTITNDQGIASESYGGISVTYKKIEMN